MINVMKEFRKKGNKGQEWLANLRISVQESVQILAKLKYFLDSDNIEQNKIVELLDEYRELCKNISKPETDLDKINSDLNDIVKNIENRFIRVKKIKQDELRII